MMKEKLKRYYGVLVHKDISEKGEIYIFADDISLVDGTLNFLKYSTDGSFEQIIFSIAAGKWFSLFAASLIDGFPCCIEHWERFQ